MNKPATPTLAAPQGPVADLNPPSTALPEEQELAARQTELDALGATLAERELALATLRAELEHFRARYWARIVPLYAELDALHAAQAESAAREAPEDVQLAEAARQARGLADESAAAAAEPQTLPPRPEGGEPLKALYRQAARLVHPDRARDEADQRLRHELMSQINAAYARGDGRAIADLLTQYRERLSEPLGDDVGSLWVRGVRALARTRNRLQALEAEIGTLQQSELARLHRQVQAQEAQGLQPLDAMVRQLQAEIDRLRRRP